MIQQTKKCSIALFIGFIIFAVGFVTFNQYRQRKQVLAKSGAEKLVSVQVETMKPRLMPQTVSAYASTVSPKSVAIRSVISGTVKSIAVKPGEHVKKGQLLIELQSSDLNSQLQQLKSKLNVDKKNYERYTEANKALPGTFAANDVDHAYATYQASLSAYNTAQKEALVDAPIAGIVSDTDLAVGSSVSVNDVLLTVMDQSSMQLKFTLPAQYQKLVKIGQQVCFFSDGLTYKARVSYIAPLLDDNGSVVLRANFDKPNTLLQNTFGKINQVINPHYKTYAVKQTRIQSDERGFYLYVLRYGKVAKQPVTVGAISADGYVTIKTGLGVTTQVIVSDTHGLSVGQKVQVNK